MPYDPDRQIQQLVAIYQSAMLEIAALVQKYRGGRTEGTQRYWQEILRQIYAILGQLDQQAQLAAVQLIGQVYSQTCAEVVQQIMQAPGQAPVGNLPTGAFAQIHQRAVDVLAQNLVDNLRSASQYVGRQMQAEIRRMALETAAGKFAGGKTVQQMRDELAERMKQAGQFGFTDRLGRRWELGRYTEMVARTLTREAASIAVINQCSELGADLVKMSSHVGTCDRCKPLQGKVYSISGNDRRYPALLPEFRPPIHPNCRHVIQPYIREMDKDADRLETESRGLASALATARKWGQEQAIRLVKKPTFAELARQEIAKGMDTLGSIIGVGKIIYDEIMHRTEKIKNDLQTEMRELEEQLTTIKELEREYQGKGDWDAVDIYRQKRKSIRSAIDKLEEKQQKIYRQVYREVMNEVRPLADPVDLHYKPGAKKAAKKCVSEALSYYPVDWVERLIERTRREPLKLRTNSNRAYFYNAGNELSLYTFAGELKNIRASIHELGHFVEHTVPEVLEATLAFYVYRTRGEELRWLGPGYGKDEQYRPDKFVSPYMGKDYGGRTTEILSMGMEDIFTQRYNTWEKDPQYMQFILGVIAGK